MRPEAPPTFAPETVDPPYPPPNTGQARYPPPKESTLLAQPGAGTELGERRDDPLSTTRDTAREDEPFSMRTARSFGPGDNEGEETSPGPEEPRHGFTPPEPAVLAGDERTAGSSGTEELPVEPLVDRTLSAPGDRPGTRGTEEAGERVAMEHRPPETGRDGSSREHRQRPASAPPDATVSEQAEGELESARDEHATESRASGAHPTERAGVHHGESRASTSPPRDGAELPNARAHVVSPSDPSSNLLTTSLGEQPAASQTLPQEKRARRPKLFSFESRERSPAAPERVEHVAEGRAPTPGTPLVSADAERATPSAAVPRRRAATEETSSPTIRITIGRVEVRAVAPAPGPAQPPTAARPEPGLSLDDYLRQHNGGRR